MRKLLLYSIILLSTPSALADLNGDGYYRVQNASSKRYAFLLDNKGSVDKTGTTADVGALELYLDASKIVSDPSTVFYVNHIDDSSSKYFHDIAGQGTSVHGFLDLYVKIMKDKVIDGTQSYLINASSSGLTKYLGDRRADNSADKGMASIDVSGNSRLWYFHPLDASSNDSFFGITPDQAVGDKYYFPFYAAFPFSFQSKGMKCYIVKLVDARGAVVIKEVDGVIPASTPVIVECSSPLPAGNRLNIGGVPSADVSGNLLNGVYFDNDGVIHNNRKAYDKKTMRTLAVKDGKLVFEVGDYDFLPRNQAYLQLTDASQYGTADFVLMTQEEYDTYLKNLVVEVSEISLDMTELNMTEGDKATLTATITPQDATDKTVTWISSNESVATVSARGEVAAVKAGSATITASSSNGKTTICKVNVKPLIIQVSSLELNRENAELKVGESITLTANIVPDNATDKTIIWSSDNESVATVDKDGTVTAISVGKALVSASSGNVSASCTVNVNPILVESLVISPDIWSGNEGSSLVITATVLPETATDKSLSWESSDVNIASVDGEGNVAVLKEGRCVIIVSTLDGSNLKAECVITSLSGVDEIMTEPDSTVDVYNVDGLLLKQDCNRGSLNYLPKGIYILRLQNGKASVLYLR